MTSASDPSKVAAARRRERDDAKQHDEDVRWVMETVQGRRLYHRYLTQFGVFRSSYVLGAPDSQTIFNEGQRNVGLVLMADIQASCPELYLRMVQEAKASVPADEPEPEESP